MERLAPRAEVRGHARATRPPRMLVHPLALSRRRVLWPLPGPVLTPGRTPRLRHPALERVEDAVAIPAVRPARVAHRRIARRRGDNRRPARCRRTGRTDGCHWFAGRAQSAVTTDFVSRE